jgi:hypothetical protein
MALASTAYGLRWTRFISAVIGATEGIGTQRYQTVNFLDACSLVDKQTGSVREISAAVKNSKYNRTRPKGGGKRPLVPGVPIQPSRYTDDSHPFTLSVVAHNSVTLLSSCPCWLWVSYSFRLSKIPRLSSTRGRCVPARPKIITLDPTASVLHVIL